MVRTFGSAASKYLRYPQSSHGPAAGRGREGGGGRGEIGGREREREMRGRFVLYLYHEREI